MDFDEAERRFFELKGRLDTARITPQEYQAQLRTLTVQAADGRTWMIGGQTGRWYYFDGGSWVQGEPRRPAPPPQPSVVREPEKCARCGQPVAPGKTLCERCDQTLGAPTAAPPLPPPVAARAPAAAPARASGGRGGWIAAAIVAVVALLACGGLAGAAVLLPGSPLRGMLPIPGFAATPTPAAMPTPVLVTTPAAEATATLAAAATATQPAPSLTAAPPTATRTPEPTATPSPTATRVPPTATPVPPTATAGPPPATPTPTAVPRPAVTGRIYYTVFDPASRTDNIYVINADGTGATQLISQGIAPSVAPDGRIAFHSLRSDQLGLVIRYPDGTTRYPRNYEVLHEDEMPSWSPDASRIALAFGTNTGDKPWRLVVMNADGTGRHDLGGFNGVHPSWGPGNLLAFRRVYSQEGLYVVSAEGGTPRLVANVGNDNAASWSPDGSRLAFMADKESTGDWEIYVTNADGSGQKNLTNSPGTIDVLPVWLPGGKNLAFRSNRGGVWGLWVMGDDGSGATRIAQAELDTSRFLEDSMSAQ